MMRSGLSPPLPLRPLDEQLRAFAVERRLCGKPGRLRIVLRMLNRFTWTAGIAAPEEITSEAVAGYLGGMLDQQGLAPKTICNHRSVINLFCTWLCAKGHLAVNPCATVPGPALERPLPHWLDEADARRALQLAEQHGIYAEVAVALNTGLRCSELQRLEWRDVDLDRRRLSVRRPKGRRDREVPLTEEAIGALRQQWAITGRLSFVFPSRQTWRGGWRWIDKARGPTWWNTALKPLQDKIPAFSILPKGSVGRGWHLFRHTFASRLVQRGVSIYKVASWLGHSDVRTTEIYAHLKPGFDADIEVANLGLPEAEEDETAKPEGSEHEQEDRDCTGDGGGGDAGMLDG